MFHPSNTSRWLPNESLDFYLSTNTFSNPMFDGNQLGVGQHNQEEEAMANLERQEEQVGAGSERTVGQEAREQSQRWANFCDNLVFSIKSKVYVLELSLKSKLRRLRRFASGHLPNWLWASSAHAGSCVGCMGRSTQGVNKDEWCKCGAAARGALPFGRWRRVAQAEPEADGSFWKNIEEPSSLDLLSQQQEKILSRLELVVQAKRSNQLRLQQLQEQLGQHDQLLLSMSCATLAPACATGEPPRAAHEAGDASCSSGSRAKLRPPLCPLNSISSPSSKLASNGARWSQPQQQQALNGAAQSGCARRASNNKLCVVCYSNPANILTLPCKHHDICSDCFIEIIYLSVKQSQYPLKCVLCRQKIERIRCSRGLLLGVLPTS